MPVYVVKNIDPYKATTSIFLPKDNVNYSNFNLGYSTQNWVVWIKTITQKPQHKFTAKMTKFKVLR